MLQEISNTGNSVHKWIISSSYKKASKIVFFLKCLKDWMENNGIGGLANVVYVLYVDCSIFVGKIINKSWTRNKKKHKLMEPNNSYHVLIESTQSDSRRLLFKVCDDPAALGIIGIFIHSYILKSLSKHRSLSMKPAVSVPFSILPQPRSIAFPSAPVRPPTIASLSVSISCTCHRAAN